MSFTVMPAVDLKEGKCVRLVQGDPRYRTVEINDPVEVALKWQARGAKRLHLVDLDGALAGERKNEELAFKIMQTLEIQVQFGGGIRAFEDASRLLDLGFEKIIIGTSAMKDSEMLAGLSDKYGSERLIVALDSRGGRVVTEGWVKDTGERPSEAAKRFESYASECLFTNVDVEGLVRGINNEAVAEMVKSTKMGVIASGGISTLKDIEAVKRAGASGVVIGTALYKGAIEFEKAVLLEDSGHD